MRFLFWNTGGLNNAPLLAALAHEHEADILIFAELETELAPLLIALNTGRQSQFFPDGSNGLSDRLQIFYRYDPSAVRIIRDEFDIAIREIAPPLGPSVLLIAVHLSSKLYLKPEDQLISINRFPRIVEEAEADRGHNRTIVIGDFNMNPFEPPMVGAGGLHAVMDRRIALRTNRTVKGEQFNFFYNPMWSLLGDRADNSPGSYYYDSGAYVNYYWNLFDQVLLRPKLAEGFVPERDVQILKSIGGTQLVRGPYGRPDHNISDHLPVLVKLELLEAVNE
jgi:hypothetical protein